MWSRYMQSIHIFIQNINSSRLSQNSTIGYFSILFITVKYLQIVYIHYLYSLFSVVGLDHRQIIYTKKGDQI